MNYQKQYLKYKDKYFKLKYDGGSDIDIDYIDNEINFIKTKFRFLIHFTSFHNFKKIINDMELRSISIISDQLDKNKKPIFYDYIVFADIVGKIESINTHWTPGFSSVGLMFDLDLLFDNYIYYWYAPHGYQAAFEDDAVPNKNIKLILQYENKTEYINSLDVNDNLKMGLKNYINSFNMYEKTIHNTFANASYGHSEREFCFFDKIDLRKYLIGVIFLDHDTEYDLNKLVPKDVPIYSYDEANELHKEAIINDW